MRRRNLKRGDVVMVRNCPWARRYGAVGVSGVVYGRPLSGEFTYWYLVRWGRGKRERDAFKRGELHYLGVSVAP